MAIQNKMILIVLALLVLTGQVNAQDSTGIPVGGQGWKLYWLNLPLGALIYAPGDKASQKNDLSMLEAKPFIGVGPSLVLARNRNFGFSGSILFYTENKSIYPILGIGVTLFDNRFAISPSWNFGPNFVDINMHEHVWQRRFMMLLSYNLMQLQQ